MIRAGRPGARPPAAAGLQGTPNAGDTTDGKPDSSPGDGMASCASWKPRNDKQVKVLSKDKKFARDREGVCGAIRGYHSLLADRAPGQCRAPAGAAWRRTRNGRCPIPRFQLSA